MAKIKVGLIGCGYWGPNHLRAFKSIPECEVISVCDVNQERFKKIASVYGDLRLTNHYEELLDMGLDAVVVSTPAITHYSIVRDLLERDINVLCEKPLTVKTKEATELVEIADKRGLILMVGHIYVYNSILNRLKQIINGGDLGDIYYISSRRLNLGPIREDVGAVYDLASHDISIANYLLDGEPMEIYAKAGSWLSKDREDTAFLALTYMNNVIVNIEASWLSPKKVRTITVVGSKRMALFDECDMSFPLIIYDKRIAMNQEYSSYGEFLKLSICEGDTFIPKVKFEEPLTVQNRHFIECIQNGKQPLSDGKFAVSVVKALEGVIQSLKYTEGVKIC